MMGFAESIAARMVGLRLGLAVLAISGTCPLFAGTVIVDSTFGHQGSITGPHFTVGASSGLLVPSKDPVNLFQSFSQLDLAKGNTLNLTGPASLMAVIVRVTGGVSHIDGTIESNVPGPLYLLDQFGVVFGKNAHLNLLSSFAVSTANYLLSGDEKRFYSVGPKSYFSVQPPSAFGFLTVAPGSAASGNIVVSGTAGAPAALAVQPGMSITMVGREVSLTHATISAPSSVSSSSAINMVAMGPDIGEVTTTSGFLPINDAGTPAVPGGAISISNATLASSGVGAATGGGIEVAGDSILLDRASVLNRSVGGMPQQQANDIDLTASSVLYLKSSEVDASTSGVATGGGIYLTAYQHLILQDTSVLSRSTQIAAKYTDQTSPAGQIEFTTPLVSANGNVLLSVETADHTHFTNQGTISINSDSSPFQAERNGQPAYFRSNDGQGNFYAAGLTTFNASSDTSDDEEQLTLSNGTQVGSNLIFSERTFDLAGGTLTIASNTTGIKNVIIQVTGSGLTTQGPSNIDGCIQCSIPGATVYLVNPAGILFGTDSGLNSSGGTSGEYSFVATTANSIGMNSLGVPTSFQFISPHPAGISVSLTPNSPSSLQVARDQTITFVGGPIQIVGEERTAGDKGLGVAAVAAGRVNLVSVASSGVVQLQTNPGFSKPSLSGFASMGEIEIAEDAVVEGDGVVEQAATGKAAKPAIFVDAGQLNVVQEANLYAGSQGISGGAAASNGAAYIRANQITLDTSGYTATTGIDAYSLSPTGSASSINLRANSLMISHGASLTTKTLIEGKNAGNISIDLKGPLVINGADVDASPFTADAAAAGSVSINADSVTVEHEGEVSSTSGNTSSNGGNISITASHNIDIVDSTPIPNTHFDDAGIKTAASGTKVGGNIVIKSVNGNITVSQSTIDASGGGDGDIQLLAPGTIKAIQSTITARATQQSGGKITLGEADPTKFVILSDSQINGEAKGTDVKVSIPVPSDRFVKSADSQILSDNVVAPVQIDIAAALVNLPANLQQPQAQLQESCPHLLLGPDISNFTLGGQGTEPLEPGGWVPDISLDSNSPDFNSTDQKARDHQ